ncbi:hypothetical protein ACOMHN_058856 [Nucella lapillus]
MGWGTCSKFLCSVLVAPVKNENADIIMFIINYEDITETATKNDIKKFQNNRHQSFKLRLPSIRRDIRSRARAIEKLPDPENPPIPEEAVPLSHLGSEEEGYSSLKDALGVGVGGLGFEGGGRAGDPAEEESFGVEESSATQDRLAYPLGEDVGGRRGQGRQRGFEEGDEEEEDEEEEARRLEECRDDVDAGPLRNHVRPSMANQQASSDSALARLQTKPRSGSLASMVTETLGKSKGLGKGSMEGGGSSSRGLLLPSVQNMKTNVTEKMAQVNVYLHETEQFKDLLLCLGPFHWTRILLRCQGKLLRGSGLDDALVECGVFGRGVIESALNGTHYVRALTGMLIVEDLIRSLQWQMFWQHKDQTAYPELEQVQALQTSLAANTRCPDEFETLTGQVEKLHQDFVEFEKECEAKSELCQFFGVWLRMVAVIKNAVVSDREGNWDLYVATVEDSMPIFAEFNCTNYQRYGSWYLEQIKVLEFTHPELYRRFSMGLWVVKDRPGWFCAVGGDMKVEQTIQRVSKGPGDGKVHPIDRAGYSRDLTYRTGRSR